MSSVILVTGANGDIGRCVVNQAIDKGLSVVATVRDPAQIASFTKNERLRFLLMSVDDQVSVKTAFDELDGILDNDDLVAVIHCAAIAKPCTIETVDIASLENTFKVNTIGSMNVLQQVLPRLRHKGGNLVFASSLWGRVSGPFVGQYAASKWALEALVDSARRENTGAQLKFVLANIGAVKSKMVDDHVTGMQKMLDNSSEEQKIYYEKAYEKHIQQTIQFDKLAIKPEKVAKRLLTIAAMSNPAPRYKIGGDAKVLSFLSWMLPTSWMDKLMGV